MKVWCKDMNPGAGLYPGLCARETERARAAAQESGGLHIYLNTERNTLECQAEGDQGSKLIGHLLCTSYKQVSPTVFRASGSKKWVWIQVLVMTQRDPVLQFSPSVCTDFLVCVTA